MKAEIYQLIVPMVGVAGGLISIRHYRRGFYTFFEAAMWIIFWIFISLVAIFPDVITVFLSKSIGIKDHINGIIFIGLAILFFLNFRLFHSLKKQNKVITDLVRQIAIERTEKNDQEQ